MTREPNKNPAASIRAKLLSLSREKGEDYQRVLGRFAIERILYRLGISSYRDRFVLKAQRSLRCGPGKPIDRLRTWICLAEFGQFGPCESMSFPRLIELDGVGFKTNFFPASVAADIVENPPIPVPSGCS